MYIGFKKTTNTTPLVGCMCFMAALFLCIAVCRPAMAYGLQAFTTLPSENKSTQFIANTSTSVKNDAAGTAIAMMRLYNPKTGEHLYTKDTNERSVLISKHGWRYEGIAWYAPARSYTPVYRLYNKRTGEHFYTSNTKERAELITRYKWQSEGVGWFSSDSKEVPVYRLFNKRVKPIGSHHYTSNKTETNTLVSKHKWKREGVAWYGVKVSIFGNPTAGRFHEQQLAGGCESYAAAFAINAALNKKATSGSAIYNFRPKEFKSGGNAQIINRQFVEKYFSKQLEYKWFNQANASPQVLASLIKEGWIVCHNTSGRYKVFRLPDGGLRYNNSSAGHEICFYAYNEKTRTFYANDSGVNNGGTILYSWDDVVNFNKYAKKYMCFRAK